MSQTEQVAEDAFDALARGLEELSPWTEDLFKPGRKLFDNTRVLQEGNRPGLRFKAAPDFSYPGPVGQRPTSDFLTRTIHFDVTAVTRRVKREGSKLVHGSEVTNSTGSKFIPRNDAHHHEGYLTKKAAENSAEKLFAGYLELTRIVENYPVLDPPEQIFSNIDDDPEVRADFWTRVHDHERERRPDTLSIHPDRLSPEDWAALSGDRDLPAEAISALMGWTAGSTIVRPRKPIELDRQHARPLIAAAGKLASWNPAKPALVPCEGRGGRTQYRLVLELPVGLASGGRARALATFCDHLNAGRVMYTAVVHTPEPQNDCRNYHAHIILYDRPCRYIPVLKKWDFKLRKQTDVNGNHIGGRADKSELLKTSNKGNFFEVGGSIVFALREKWVECCNAEAARADLPVRYDARSFIDLGIDQEPAVHLGPDEAAVGAVGVPTENNLRGWRGEDGRRRKRHELIKATRMAPIIDALAKLKAAGAELMTEQAALLADYQASAELLAAREKRRDDFYLVWDMVRSSALRTQAVCRSLLDGIGRPVRKPILNYDLIIERQAAAQAHLDRIAGIVRPLAGCAVALGREIERDGDVLATKGQTLLAALDKALEDHARAARTAISPVVGARDPIAAKEVSTDREMLTTSFDRAIERITKDKPFIEATQASGATIYSVAGITPDESRILTMPQFRHRAQKFLAGEHKFQEHGLTRLEAFARKNPERFAELASATVPPKPVPRSMQTYYNRFRDHSRIREIVRDLALRHAEPVGQPDLANDAARSSERPEIERRARAHLAGATSRATGTPGVPGTPMSSPLLPISAHLDRLSEAADVASPASGSREDDEAGSRLPLSADVEAGPLTRPPQRDEVLGSGRARDNPKSDYAPEKAVSRTVIGLPPINRIKGTTDDNRTAERLHERRRLLARGRILDDLHRSYNGASAEGASATRFSSVRPLSSIDLGSHEEGGDLSLSGPSSHLMVSGLGTTPAMQ